MKISQLQGTPWHYENRKKTCKEGSKYCLYNHNICSCKVSIHYHKKCVGKGVCDDFESRGGTAKTLVEKNYNIKETEKKMAVQETSNKDKESKEEKFLRVSKGRIDKVEEAINNLENLSDKASYAYTDDQVDKMFDYLYNKLDTVKDRFKNGYSGGFSWDD